MIDQSSGAANARFQTATQMVALLEGVRRTAGGYMARCPCHRDQTPSLSVRDGDSAVITKCFSKGCSYSEIVAAIGQPPPMDETRYHKTNRNQVDRREQARELWTSSSTVVKGDPVWTYLCETRRLPLKSIPLSIRIHPNHEYWEAVEVDGDERWAMVGRFPTMVAAFSSLDSNIVAVHRTYLTADGQKAFGSQSGRRSRKVLGSINGAAIRLAPTGPQLGIAEGIETAIAASLLWGIPTWSAYSSSNMQNVLIPACVEEIIVFGDNDQSAVGRDAAHKLARRIIAEGRKAKVVIPDQLKDWADVLVEESK